VTASKIDFRNSLYRRHAEIDVGFPAIYFRFFPAPGVPSDTAFW
jgi:hypothetical protein